MGWSSATNIFDAAVDVIVKFNGVIATERAVKEVYSCIDWGDWDTQNESKYFFPYLMDVMHAIGEIDDEEYVEQSHYYQR